MTEPTAKWGTCAAYTKNDGTRAAPHNHLACTCPRCDDGVIMLDGIERFFCCVMTERWMLGHEIQT